MLNYTASNAAQNCVQQVHVQKASIGQEDSGARNTLVTVILPTGFMQVLAHYHSPHGQQVHVVKASIVK